MDIRKKMYNIYNHINYRCYNPNCPHFDRYGGRGITNELGTFDEFFVLMKDSYIEHLEVHGSYNTTLDRIDNDGSYTYDNIRWATRKEQANNRNTTVYFRVHNILDDSFFIYNNMMDFCSRTQISWTSLKKSLDSGKPIDNFFIEYVDVSDIDIETLNECIYNDMNKPILINAYNISNEVDSVNVINLKEWCRNNGVDPSAAYKCAKGKRKTVNGFKVKIIQITV